MSKLQTLLEKRDALIDFSDYHRDQISIEINNLEAPISIADRVWTFVTFVKENPLIVTSVMSLVSTKFRHLSAVLTSGKALFSWFKKSKQ